MSDIQEEHDLGSRKMPPEVRRGLITVAGNTLYLKAPHRILWLRSEHPDWEIRTEIVEGGYQAGLVVVKATICNENGRVLATAHKEEKSGKFPFLSKAETGAIARALAIVGYGTQFGEIDDDGPDSVADSPIPCGARNAPPQRNEWTKQPTQRHNEQAYGQQEALADRAVRSVLKGEDPHRPPNVDKHGEVHDDIPSRPPLSAKQQAMEDFRAAARAIDERYGHPSFKPEDMAKMVKAINEDGAAWEDVARNIPSWKYATWILKQFKAQNPTTSAETALKAIRFKFRHELPMVEFTATMWESPFPDSAQRPHDARIDAVAMMQGEEVGSVG